MGAPAEVMVLAALRTELVFVRSPKAALGMGEAARDGLRRVLSRFSPEGVVFLGYCGGLVEGLPSGALVLADRLHGPEGTIRPSAKILGKAKTLLPEAHVGPLFTYPSLLAKEAARKKVRDEEVSPLGVDMEANFVAAELFRRKIPFLVAKIVLDSWEEEVSLGLGRFLWAPRAVWCSWKLGRVAPKLRQALEEGRG